MSFLQKKKTFIEDLSKLFLTVEKLGRLFTEHFVLLEGKNNPV